jgi:hypothetical protein
MRGLNLVAKAMLGEEKIVCSAITEHFKYY